MTLEQIFITIVGTAIAIIGYFLKIVHTDVRDNTNSAGRLRGRLDLIEQASQGSVQKLTEVTEIQIKQLTASIDKQAETVSELSAIVQNIHGNMQAGNSEIMGRLDKIIKGPKK